MKKLLVQIKGIKVLLLSVLLIGGSFSAQASHLAAADIHVDYVPTAGSPYTYKITLNVYKACETGAIDLDTITTLHWESASGCAVGGLGDMGKPKIDTLDQLCDTFKAANSCRDITSVYPAFVRHTWVKVVTLPGACPDWVFWWSLGARNTAILNINGGNLYVDAMINNTKKARVHTPRYTIDPIPYFCLNADIIFPNGPVDPDLDSMTSINLEPRCGGAFPSGTCGYRTTPAPGYSLTNPIASSPLNPYTLDPNTATATFTPTIPGKFVLAFQTFDYDRQTGELLGFTTRDVQVSVLGCLAPPPATDTFPSNIGGSGYIDKSTGTLYACPGQNVRFDLGSTSKSIYNKIYARWDVSSLPGATWSASGDGTGRVVGTLNWTPDKSQVGTHIVSLRFVDSTCSFGQPLLLKSIYVLKIVVLPAVDGGKDGIFCLPGGAPWKMQTILEPGMRFKWSSIFGSPTTPPPFMDDDTLARPSVQPGVYTSYLVEGSIFRGPYRCTTRDTVDVRIGIPTITVSAGPDKTVCANKPVMLDGKVEPFSDLDSLNWTPSATLDDSTLMTPTATPYVSTNYVLYAEDKNGCGLIDTMKVIVDGFQPNIAPFASRDTVCPEGFTQLFANVSQQPCGIAQAPCTGGSATDKTIGTGTIGSLAPTPFYHIANSAGERMQILYRRDELLELGIKAGFINSMSFNLPAKNTTDSFYKFSIKMACTGDAALTGSTMTTYGGTSVVLPPQTIYTNTGWNTFSFPNSYYWDGSSNLLVEVCWSKVYGAYGGTADPVFATSTSYTSVKYIRDYSLPAPAMGEGCGLTAGTPLLSSTRPNTRFNICIPSSIFKYSWTPTSYLNQPDSANTNVNGIKEDIDYNIKVTSSSNPNCFATGVVPIKVDRTNSVTALPVSPVIQCRPGYYYDLTAVGSGPRPLRNLMCGVNDTVFCLAPITRIIANPGTAAMYAEPSNHAFNGAYTTAHTQYIVPKSSIRLGNMNSGTIRSISIDVAAAASMDFTNLKIGLKCTDLKQFNSTPPVIFETGVVQVYSSTNEAVGSTGSGYHTFTFQTPYNWDTTKNLLVDLCYSQAVAGSGPSVNTYRTQGFNLMAQSYQTSGDVCTNPSTEIGPVTYELLPSFQFGYCPAGDTDFTFSWSPGDYFQDSLLQNPIVSVDSTMKIYVKTQGRNGCIVRDSVTILVPKNARFVTQDTIICLNESVQLRSYYGTKTRWYENTSGGQYSKPVTLSCDSCERTIASPKQTTTYYAAVTDENGCLDTFRTSVTVKPLPGVNITNRDTVIKYGKSVVLNAFGGSQYVWTPIAGLSNANNVSPTATPLVTTVYHVAGVGLNGCRGNDSVKITIDYKSPISVPSGFTPNGDGKNDKFRLMGVTFQTLMEFRVFNRWGQEMFSTTNINDGWDGTYKGKEQDMGAYNYIIRVGYPDGDAQTFKGDVSLIR